MSIASARHLLNYKLDFRRACVSSHVEYNALAHAHICRRYTEISRIADLFPIDTGYQIARLQPGIHSQPETSRQCRVYLFNSESPPDLSDSSVAEYLVGNPFGSVYRYGEAEILITARFGYDKGVDPCDLSQSIDRSPPLLPWFIVASVWIIPR